MRNAAEKPSHRARRGPGQLGRTLSLDELRQHILHTYFDSRVLLCVLGFAFPALLWLAGRLWAGLPLQSSMSAYYHAVGPEGRSMRDVFVGILFVVAGLLWVYRGYGKGENWLLSLAAIMAAGVALFPMDWECGQSCAGYLSVHGACAVLFFACIACVAIFCRDNTLRLTRQLLTPAQVKRLESTYWATGILMVAGPLAAFSVRALGRFDEWIFAAESAGVLGFAWYWGAKTRELRLAKLDEHLAPGDIGGDSAGSARPTPASGIPRQ